MQQGYNCTRRQRWFGLWVGLTVAVGIFWQDSLLSRAFTGAWTAAATYTLIKDMHGETTIQVTGARSVITLNDIKEGLGTANQDYVLALEKSVWRLNANVLIGPSVTLNLSPETGVSEVQLRSERNSQVSSSARQAIDYSSFVYLKTEDGIINLDGIKLYSWDTAANQVDENVNNGRAFILAKYAATLNIRSSDIGYLGSEDDESYGISWRDQNDPNTPDQLRTRVTGEVLDSQIHHNYYGIYTFQAENMLFRGNAFHHNVRYGFDPHDYSHHFTVENNVAYANGAHGFIISRGCHNFVFRHNKAYDNVDPDANQAHGFMLDPGGVEVGKPRVPSTENLLENNEAYGNEGFGIRVLESHDNIIRNNYFHHNTGGGISIDLASERNTVQANQLIGNALYGVFLREGSRNSKVIENLIEGNGNLGIYIRASDNEIRANTIRQNGADGLELRVVEGFPLPANNLIQQNVITGNSAGGVDIFQAQSNTFLENLIADNPNHGVYLDIGSNRNRLESNIIRGNTGYGIGASGAATVENTWSKNSIFANQLPGIALLDGANQQFAAPILLSADGTTLIGQAKAGATVEVFADNISQGEHFEGAVTAGADGRFSFTTSGSWRAVNLTAITIDSQGNASSFSAPIAFTGGGPTATPTSTATPTATSTPTPTPSRTPDPRNSTERIFLPNVQR